MEAIKIQNLSFSYTKNEVLNDINLLINRGSISVILGLNGCGKTTLLKLIVGLLKTKENTIFIENEDITKIKQYKKSKLISYVPQLTNNEEDFLVRDFLLFGFVSDLKFYEKPSKSQLERMLRSAEKFEIENFLNKKLNELSGGERQKVYICSAYLQDTPIIVLDEPLSALDLKSQSLIVNILKELKEENKTIILSTHNPNISLALDSEVILMNKGNITKTGYCKDVINVEVLKDIYGDNLVYSKEVEYDEVTISI